MSGCIRDGSKKIRASWLQEPEKMMDPAQEEPRVLYRFLSSEKETEAEMENLAKSRLFL